MHSGLKGCSVALGVSNFSALAAVNSTVTEADLSTYAPWLDVELDNFATAYNLVLPPNTLVYWNVRCVDNVGNEAAGSSSGFLVDLTAPVLLDGAVAVKDGSEEAVASGSVNLTSPSATAWRFSDRYMCRFGDIYDPESGIAFYKVSLTLAGTMQGPFFASTIVRDAQFASFLNLDLADNAKIYCVVQAFNGVNMSATWMSDGVSGRRCSYHSMLFFFFLR